MSSRPTIAISAFAANPKMSSETGIGWSFIRTTAQNAVVRNAKVVAVTNLRSAEAIRKQLVSEGLGDVVETIGLDMPKFLKFLKDPRLTRLEYILWWMLARRVFQRLEKERHLVLAHHVTFATEIFPTPITAVSKAVYKVWGPVGSAGDPAVYQVRPLMRGIRSQRVGQAFRDLIAAIPARHFGRRVHLVLAQNEAVAEMFKRKRVPARVFPNVVLKPELQGAIDQARSRQVLRGEDSPLKILSVGHLIPRKRFDLGLALLTEECLAGARYELLGRPLEGVRDDLPRRARELGVADRVCFGGKLSRDQVLAAMANSDVLLHPSGREGASGVIGEATAVGIPVVCFANTGAASVLEASGSSGVIVQAKVDLSLTELAGAVLRAASMERRPSLEWTEDRFRSMCAELYDAAVRHRTLQRIGNAQK